MIQVSFVNDDDHYVGIFDTSNPTIAIQSAVKSFIKVRGLNEDFTYIPYDDPDEDDSIGFIKDVDMEPILSNEPTDRSLRVYTKYVRTGIMEPVYDRD